MNAAELNGKTLAELDQMLAERGLTVRDGSKEARIQVLLTAEPGWGSPRDGPRERDRERGVEREVGRAKKGKPAAAAGSPSRGTAGPAFEVWRIPDTGASTSEATEAGSRGSASGQRPQSPGFRFRQPPASPQLGTPPSHPAVSETRTGEERPLPRSELGSSASAACQARAAFESLQTFKKLVKGAVRGRRKWVRGESLPKEAEGVTCFAETLRRVSAERDRAAATTVYVFKGKAASAGYAGQVLAAVEEAEEAVRSARRELLERQRRVRVAAWESKAGEASAVEVAVDAREVQRRELRAVLGRALGRLTDAVRGEGGERIAEWNQGVEVEAKGRKEIVERQIAEVEGGVKEARACMQQYAAAKKKEGMGASGGVETRGMQDALRAYDAWKESFAGREEQSRGTDTAMEVLLSVLAAQLPAMLRVGQEEEDDEDEDDEVEEKEQGEEEEAAGEDEESEGEQGAAGSSGGGEGLHRAAGEGAVSGRADATAGRGGEHAGSPPDKSSSLDKGSSSGQRSSPGRRRRWLRASKPASSPASPADRRPVNNTPFAQLASQLFSPSAMAASALKPAGSVAAESEPTDREGRSGAAMHKRVAAEKGSTKGGQGSEVAGERVRDSLLLAAQSVDREMAWQRTDHLAQLPCRPLLQAAHALLELLRPEAQVLARVCMLVKDLREEQQLLATLVDDADRLKEERAACVVNLQQSLSAALQHKDDLELVAVQLRQARQAMQRGAGPDKAKALEDQHALLQARIHASRGELRERVGEVMRLEQDFPELMLPVQGMVQSGVDGESLTPHSLAIFDPLLSLHSFEERSLLAAPPSTRHAVYKVRAGREWFAVKEYVLSSEAQLARSLKEAGLLRRLRHPAIAELVAVFVDVSDAKKMYLQMPLYAHGPLDVWLQTRAPSWPVVRRALLDVLGALAHMHALKVVHADVKPANILVGDGDRARLSDLDVSVDNATRTGVLYATATRQVAVSHGFTAPEVMEKGAGPAADVFSLGKTLEVEAVFTACLTCNAARKAAPGADPTARAAAQADKPREDGGGGDDGGGGGREGGSKRGGPAGENAEEEEDTESGEKSGRELVAWLTAGEASKRPSARAAMAHPFFAARSSAGAGAFGSEGRGRGCCVKASERCLALAVPVHHGVECGQGHFVCGECVDGVAQASLASELRLRRARAGRIMCPKFPTECSAPPLAEAALMKVLSPHLVTAYLASRLELLEAEKVQELEEEYAGRMEAELERLRRMEEVEWAVAGARKHVEEAIFQLTCPRCRTAYYDFDGCCALKCAQAGCGCGFCAWCGRDCGDDAHRHVAACGRRPVGADRFFGTEAQVRAVWRQQQGKELTAYLATLGADVREGLMASIGELIQDRIPGFRPPV